MAIREYKPTSPARRNYSVSDFAEITATKPHEKLIAPLRKTGGRNNQGITTTRFRGGGHKRRYRIIDFKRDKDNVEGVVETIEYDPNRSCRIALIKYLDGERRYILAPKNLKVGNKIVSGEKVEPRTGNCMPLKNIPLGLEVHNIELKPGKGGQLARSAGTVVTLSARDAGLAHLVLPSGEIRKVSQECRATIGQVGNVEHSNIKIGKAGRKRWLGRRPHNRGTSMNPIAHPMGGGEGRSGGGRHPCGPTGKLSKGGKTRRKRNPSNKLIIRRRKKK